MLPKILQSSVNPEKVSMTVKGFLVSLLPLGLVLLGLVHANVGVDDLNQLINSVTAVVFAASATLSSVLVVYGLIRKLLVEFGMIKV